MVNHMLVMGGAMLFARRLDQDDASVLMYTRFIFGTYLLVIGFIHTLLHFRVMTASDTSPLTVPPPPPAPFVPPPEGDPPSPTVTTVRAYDLGLLASARKSWLLNACVLTAIHAKTGAVNPLVMSAVMGLFKIVDEPLFRLHVLRAPATGVLERPFKPEVNAIAKAMEGFMPKPEDLAAASGGEGAGDEPQIEELHSDGEGEEDDGRVRSIAEEKEAEEEEESDFCEDKKYK